MFTTKYTQQKVKNGIAEMLNCRSLVWLKSDDAEGGSDYTDVGLDRFRQDRCRGRPVLVWLKVFVRGWLALLELKWVK